MCGLYVTSDQKQHLSFFLVWVLLVQSQRKQWILFRKLKRSLPTRFPVFTCCHTFTLCSRSLSPVFSVLYITLQQIYLVTMHATNCTALFEYMQMLKITGFLRTMTCKSALLSMCLTYYWPQPHIYLQFRPECLSTHASSYSSHYNYTIYPNSMLVFSSLAVMLKFKEFKLQFKTTKVGTPCFKEVRC